MPLARLAEVESEGVVGSSALSHYSFMGYILKEQELLETSAAAIITRMKTEGVDAVRRRRQRESRWPPARSPPADHPEY